jgi:hypothetical protein
MCSQRPAYVCWVWKPVRGGFGGDFVPDEVGAAYYSRGDMGPKFLAEAPTWRPDADHPTRAAPFSSAG